MLQGLPSGLGERSAGLKLNVRRAKAPLTLPHSCMMGTRDNVEETLLWISVIRVNTKGPVVKLSLTDDDNIMGIFLLILRKLTVIESCSFKKINQLSKISSSRVNLRLQISTDKLR